MAWHLNDSVESFLRFELKPEWLPFKAHTALNHYNWPPLATSTQVEKQMKTFTAMLTIFPFVPKRNTQQW